MACIETFATVYKQSGIEQIDRERIFCYGRIMIWGGAADEALREYESSGFECTAHLRHAEYCIKQWAGAEMELERLSKGTFLYLDLSQ